MWETWRPATCLPNHCFCERVLDQLVKQPANAISGTLFLGLAALILLNSLADMKAGVAQPFATRPVFPVLFAAAITMVGLGTTFYHASLTFAGQTADVLGMYLIVTFILFYSLACLKRIPPYAAALGYVIGNGVLLTGLILVPAARRYVFAVLVIAAITLEMRARHRNREASQPYWFALAIGTLAIGFIIWSLDITRIICDPSSWIQGHAVWHMCGALAIWFVFLYLTSVTPRAHSRKNENPSAAN